MRSKRQTNHGVPASWHMGIRALACLMLCATLTTAATAWAEDAAEPPAEPAVVEAPPPTAVPPTPVPPTPIPPTPTPGPPTPTPIPPTATLEPTAVPATEAPATEQPADPAAPEASPTEASSPTPTPTPVPLDVDCIEPIALEPVLAGEVVEFECTFTGGPFTPVMVKMPSGWEYSFDGKEETYSDDLLIDTHVIQTETGKLTIYLRATEEAHPGESEFELEFRAKNATPDSTPIEVTLRATLELPPTPSTLTYQLAAQPDCRLDPTGSQTLAVGADIEYLCNDEVILDGTHVIPNEVDLEWTIWVDAGGGWTIQLLPPANDASEILEWTSPGLTETSFRFDQESPLGVMGEPLEVVDMKTTITYRLRVHRTTCDMSPQVIRVQRTIAIEAPGTDFAPASDPSISITPLQLMPELQPIPEPVLTYSGMNFGAANWTGSSYAPVKATVDMTVVTELPVGCSPVAWSVEVTVWTLSNGEIEVPAQIEFTGGVFTSDSISLAQEGILAPGETLLVASGIGSGTATLSFSLVLPPTTPSGSYRAAMNLEIVTNDIRVTEISGPDAWRSPPSALLQRAH